MCGFFFLFIATYSSVKSCWAPLALLRVITGICILSRVANPSVYKYSFIWTANCTVTNTTMLDCIELFYLHVLELNCHHNKVKKLSMEYFCKYKYLCSWYFKFKMYYTLMFQKKCSYMCIWMCHYAEGLWLGKINYSNLSWNEWSLLLFFLSSSSPAGWSVQWLLAKRGCLILLKFLCDALYNERSGVCLKHEQPGWRWVAPKEHKRRNGSSVVMFPSRSKNILKCTSQWWRCEVLVSFSAIRRVKVIHITKTQ